MCKKAGVDHLLLHCEYTRGLCSFVSCLFGVQLVMAFRVWYCWRVGKGVLLSLAMLIFGMLYLCALCGWFEGSVTTERWG